MPLMPASHSKPLTQPCIPGLTFPPLLALTPSGKNFVHAQTQVQSFLNRCHLGETCQMDLLFEGEME